jgi:hypothetical protein
MGIFILRTCRYSYAALIPNEAIITEICAALSTPPTQIGDSCFVSNSAMECLNRHGNTLLPAIEAVLHRGNLANETPKWFVESNVLHLLLIYFEKADESNWDAASFLASISERLRHRALIAVFQIWGPTRGANRRRIMPRRLFDIFQSLVPRDTAWLADPNALQKLVADGSLALS